MCGIAGVVKKDGSKIAASDIKMMTDIITHRGPDDEGLYLGSNFALGHRRLSILDLSPAGHEPLVYRHLKIVFNGEIYNYIELRLELQKLGYTFNTATDTEVIVAAYLEWGADCVNHFNGMWAFCIYDEVRHILFCSRDRFGIKPFYYVNDHKIFAFGSEIKQLHTLGFNKVNLQILTDFLYCGYQNHTSGTFFKDIQQLEPSHNLVYDLRGGELSVEKYYELSLKEDIYALDEPAAEAHYREKINDAILLRLRSDVKVGTCLSGGLDSSFIASVAAKYYTASSSGKFTSITARSADPANDETKYAHMVIRNSGLDGKIVTPDFGQINEDLDTIVFHQEEPFGGPSVFMQYYVMKAAKEQGCTVLLDGQGGDETLLGYERYYMSFLRNLPLAEIFKWFKKIKTNSKLDLKDIVNYYFYFNYPRLRINHLKKRLPGLRKEAKQYLDDRWIYNYANASKQVLDLQKLEITKTQLRSLLNYEDKNSMAWSIETRLPFLDYKAVEAAISIKPAYKINDGWSKYLLRKISEKDLPAEIAWRKNKTGFEAPRAFWSLKENFENEIFQSEILNYLFEDIKSIGHAKASWKLLSIALWEKAFNIKLD